MKSLAWRLSIAVLLLAAGIVRSDQRARAQEPIEELPYSAEVAALMEQMDPRDRVGQLFLVTFTGDTADADTLIADLILSNHIGGVILLAANDNITDYGDPPTQIAGLSNALQTRAFEVSQQEKSILPEETEPPSPSPFIPLFVAMDHEGDGSPFTRIHSGVTEIPNGMAIGATWNPNHAETVGRIVGAELTALGINMLLGPSLDVLGIPRPDSPGGMGTRAFGGDPYWVGVMGQAYTRGVHGGGGNRIAVVAKHFPGHGGSDRQPDQEVSTVRKSLEQLKQIELAPFFAVTGDAPAPESAADALMTSHIRYQGFQGNIRESTRPISFDPEALATIMELADFAAWRSAGGVIVSDALGVRAVKRFYDPQLQEFPHRQVAQDAFLAGNDVLLLSEFAMSYSFADQVANIKDTLEWFYEMYNTDVSFQARVDESVERILRLKLKLYGGGFSLDNILVPVSQAAAQVGYSRGDIVLLAQDAITLIAPGPEELAERLPSPPNRNEYIAIFTDIRGGRQCSTCPEHPSIEVNALQDIILRLYGPNGTNQVLPGHVNSFSFQELEAFLQPPVAPSPPATTTLESEITPEPPLLIETALERADWIILAMLDVTANENHSTAIKTFLSERPDIASGAKMIVLAFNAPYFLDTTEISKLTAYYGIYSRIEPFVEASVKTIFQQFKPRGASPVSIPSTGYDLTQITTPDPNQIIQLYFDQGEPPADTVQIEETPAPPDFRVGDSFRLRTGVILDHNGNPVPDGTPVRFTISYLSEGLGLDVPQPEVPTTDGVARIDIVLGRPGQLQIKASSGEARASVALAVTAFEDQPPIVQEITPTATDTPTVPPPTLTATATPIPPTPTLPATPTSTPTPSPIVVPFYPTERWVGVEQLVTALAGIAIAAGGGFGLGRATNRSDPAASIRLALLTMVGGLLGYLYYALGMPGTDQINAWMGRWSATLLAWAAGLLTLSIGGLQSIRRR